jgi:UDP-N-acetylmuramate--alanine ligase
MHIFFSGIGGTAIGPLAIIAKQAGFHVSGSDKQDSQYIQYLKKLGITDIHIGQTHENITATHTKEPIDWYVYSSAIAMENPDSPEFAFCREHGITMTKRDELLTYILREKNLKLLAIAGTQGKTTTTAMAIWLFAQLKLPISYSVGAKISFGDMGHYDPQATYFIYEADEFDRNFLAFEPYLSVITGVSWDHHEIFPTREDYKQAFREFISQSHETILWREDNDYLELALAPSLKIKDTANPHIANIQLAGQYNRMDAWLIIEAVHKLTGEPIEKLIKYMNRFPGSQRRMEQITPGLYSDYAHTPEKIRGAMSVALELAAKKEQDLIVVYEPLTNRRQSHMLHEYKDCFAGATHVYWTPSYLAREDPNAPIISPQELISYLDDPSLAEPADLDTRLVKKIQSHLTHGDMVVAMAGGGGGSLDEWLRANFHV